MKAWPAFWQWMRQWGSDSRGAAVVEFALILPLMLTLYVGSLEASVLITMDRKVQSVAGAVGDLVARSDETVTRSQLTDYFRAASGILSPYPSTSLKQVVTSVEILADGTIRVDWSQTFNGGTARTAKNPPPVPNEIKNIARGKYLIIAEASAPFQPMLGIVFTSRISLSRNSFFMPRFGGQRIQFSDS